jgi:hypothetical protein
MSNSLSNNFSEQKNFVVVPKQSFEEEQYELDEMKLNSSEVWVNMALRQKLISAKNVELIHKRVEFLFNASCTETNKQNFHQACENMKYHENELKVWTNIYEERAKNWNKKKTSFLAKYGLVEPRKSNKF